MATPDVKYMGVMGTFYKHPRRRLTNIEDLKRADHIVFQRTGYEHHAIVTAVSIDKNTYTAIEYGKSTKGVSVEFVKHTFQQGDDKIYVVEYDRSECLPDDQVIANASALVGNKKYNLIFNNCECMANACKTGKGRTEQVRNFLKETARGVGVLVGGAVFSIPNDIYSAVCDVRKAKKLEKAGTISKEESSKMKKAVRVRTGTRTGGVFAGAAVGLAVGGPLGGIIGMAIGRAVAGHLTKGVMNHVQKENK